MTFCDEMKQLKKSLVENNVENENRYKIEVEKEIKSAIKTRVEQGFSTYHLADSDLMLSSYLATYKLIPSRAEKIIIQVIRSLGLKINDGSNIVTGWAD